MPDAARFNSAAPCLSVRNMVRSLEFYRRVLGFEPGHLEDDPPVYATLHRDDVAIHLALDPDGNKPGTSSCCVFVTNVDALYDACVAVGRRSRARSRTHRMACGISISRTPTAT